MSDAGIRFITRCQLLTQPQAATVGFFKGVSLVSGSSKLCFPGRLLGITRSDANPTRHSIQWKVGQMSSHQRAFGTCSNKMVESIDDGEDVEQCEI